VATSSASQNPHVALVYPGWTPPPLETLAEGALLGKPADVIEQALMTYRLLMINHVKTELSKSTEVTGLKLLSMLDMAGQLYLGKFNALVGPVSTAQFIKAYQQAHSGDIPLPVIYALAEQHTARIGTYFNQTSRESLSQGFNTFVNQKMPPRIAAERALDAYGLTPRQMAGYTSLAPEGKVLTSQPRSIKAKALDYIGRSIRRRFKIFATQEAHNLDMQSKQTAWMWMQTQGLVDPAAEKVWITAKDERVCKLCGPLHGKRAAVNDQFTLVDGSKLWVPGVHVNCRCEVRLVEPMLVEKALDGDELEEFNDEHPRGTGGRFTRKPEADVPQRQRVRETPTEQRPYAEPVASPFLEQVAEQVAAQEALDELLEIELPVETQAVSLAPKEESKAVSIERGAKAVQLSKPVSLRPAAVSLTQMQQQPVALQQPTQPAVRLATEQKAVALRDAVVQAVVLGTRQYGPPPPPKHPEEYAPTMHLPKPLYVVLNRDEFDSDDKFESLVDYEWTTDEGRAAQQAADEMQMQISDEFDTIVSGGHKIQISDKYGVTYTGVVHVEDVEDLVYSVAYATADPDVHWEKMTADITYTTDDGERMWTDKITYGELATHWGISSEDFDVRVVRAFEGHDSTLGRTVQTAAETKYGMDEWNLTGKFGTEYSHTQATPGYGPAIRFYQAWPDVEKRPYGETRFPPPHPPVDEDYIEGID
jgi:hypothetical protein